MENVIQLLEDRGFIEATTGPELKELVKKPLKLYCGFDPTSDSLHLGNMIAIMGLAWFQRCGHIPYAIVGGATGMIGDPSGRSSERNLLDEATLQRNLAGIERDLRPIFSKDPTRAPVQILNNFDWFKNFSFMNFLRDVGKHFRVGVMLGKESVRARLQSEEGISFTEFSYQLLQAYDFFHLYQQHGVVLQIGGSDQWGNITAGCDLVRKLCGATVHGATIPLLTKSDGQKFGKSEKGAIWLSPDKLSPYEFYQYLVRVEDRDVIRMLKVLTFLPLDEIYRLEQQMKSVDYVPNTVQKILAQQVTELVHGDEGFLVAKKATEMVMLGRAVDTTATELRLLMKDLPSQKMSKQVVVDKKLIDVVTSAGFMSSKSEVRRLIRSGGLYLNNDKIDDEEYLIRKEQCIEGEFLLFAFGKKNKAILQVTEL